jgi:hypothetical protein
MLVFTSHLDNSNVQCFFNRRAFKFLRITLLHIYYTFCVTHVHITVLRYFHRIVITLQIIAGNGVAYKKHEKVRLQVCFSDFREIFTRFTRRRLFRCYGSGGLVTLLC